MKKKKMMIAMTFLLMLTLLIPMSANAVDAKSFPDVQKHWVRSTVDWATERDMVKGYPDGKFHPDDKVTESEFLTMLIRLYDPTYTGTVDKHWADPYYTYAKEMNYILPGHSNVKARDVYMNRYQVAELIAATEGVNYKGADAVKYLLVYNLAKGKDKDQSVKSYHGEDTLTRAEALQFVRNLSEFGLGGLIMKPDKASDPNDIPALTALTE